MWLRSLVFGLLAASAASQFVMLDNTALLTKGFGVPVTIPSGSKVGTAFSIPRTKQLTLSNFFAGLTVPADAPNQGTLTLNIELYPLGSAASPFLIAGQVPAASATVFLDVATLRANNYDNVMLPSTPALVARSSVTLNWAIVVSAAPGQVFSWYPLAPDTVPTSDFGVSFLGNVGGSTDFSTGMFSWLMAPNFNFLSCRSAAWFEVDPNWIEPSPSALPPSASPIPPSPSSVPASPSSVPVSPSPPPVVTLSPPVANVVFTLTITGVPQTKLRNAVTGDYADLIAVVNRDLRTMVTQAFPDPFTFVPAGAATAPLIVVLPNPVSSATIPVLLTVSQPVLVSFTGAAAGAAQISQFLATSTTANAFFSSTRAFVASAGGLPDSTTIRVGTVAAAVAVSTTNAPGSIPTVAFTPFAVPSLPPFLFPSPSFAMPSANIEFKIRLLIQQFAGATINLPSLLAVGTAARTAFEAAMKNDLVSLLASKVGVTGVPTSNIALALTTGNGVPVRRMMTTMMTTMTDEAAEDSSRQLQTGATASPSRRPMASPSRLATPTRTASALPLGSFLDVTVRIPIVEPVQGVASTYANLMSMALMGSASGSGGASPSPGTGGSSTAATTALLPSTMSALQQAAAASAPSSSASFSAAVVAAPAAMAAVSASPFVSPSGSNDGGSSGGKGGATAGGIIGGLFLFGIIIAIAVVMSRRTKRVGQVRRLSKNPRRGSVGGAIVVNPVGMSGVVMAPAAMPAPGPIGAPGPYYAAAQQPSQYPYAYPGQPQQQNQGLMMTPMSPSAPPPSSYPPTMMGSPGYPTSPNAHLMQGGGAKGASI